MVEHYRLKHTDGADPAPGKPASVREILTGIVHRTIGDNKAFKTADEVIYVVKNGQLRRIGKPVGTKKQRRDARRAQKVARLAARQAGERQAAEETK